MSTLNTQYNNYIKKYPDSGLSFNEWHEQIWVPVIEKYSKAYNDNEDDIKVWDVTLLDGLEDEEGDIL